MSYEEAHFLICKMMGRDSSDPTHPQVPGFRREASLTIAHQDPLYAKRVESEKAVWMSPDWVVSTLVSGSVGDGTILP